MAGGRKIGMDHTAAVPAFCVRGLSKEYTSREGDRFLALDGISFEAAAGEITCIIGPTGSGKSTILRIVSAMENAEAGEVSVAGLHPVVMTGKVGYLAQRHTLFPWMNVRDNIGIPLEIKGAEAGQRKEKIAHLCDLLGLQKAGDLYPHELSGGMQQRAALGRLLATESAYWLLDEPFSALDDRTTHQLQRLLLTLVRAHEISVLFVTHSIDEAVFLADRIIVLSAGPGRVVEQLAVDMPHPRNRLSPEFGRLMEGIRCRIESVLDEGEGHPPYDSIC